MSHSFTVLLVEDNGADVELFRHIVGAVLPHAIVHSVWNGVALIAYLSGDHQYADRSAYPSPDLIVLDLSLPGMDGLQILKWWRGSPFQNVPLVVLSDRPEQLNQAVELGAHAAYSKGCDFHELRLAIGSICAGAELRRTGIPAAE